MRKHVSALFPLRNASKNSFEVLRLGSGERRETDPRTSNGSMPPNCIRLCIGALALECRKGRLGRCDGDDARHPEAAMRC